MIKLSVCPYFSNRPCSDLGANCGGRTKISHHRTFKKYEVVLVMSDPTKANESFRLKSNRCKLAIS